MSKATEKELSELHGVFARELKKLITKKHYKVVKDKEGEELAVEEGPSPALLNVARQFLKDNKIECDVNTYKGNKEFLQPEDLPFDGEIDPSQLN